MNTLRLENINLHAAYTVWQVAAYFYFSTDYGVEYRIHFLYDEAIVSSGAYQIVIENRNNQPSPADPKLQQTLFAIIEEFLATNDNVMLYLCETGDGKQKFRSRLFIRWFNGYKYRDKYLFKTAEGEMDGELNFMALLIKLTNPRLPYVVEEFNETVSFLFDTPLESSNEGKISLPSRFVRYFQVVRKKMRGK